MQSGPSSCYLFCSISTLNIRTYSILIVLFLKFERFHMPSWLCDWCSSEKSDCVDADQNTSSLSCFCINCVNIYGKHACRNFTRVLKTCSDIFCISTKWQFLLKWARGGLNMYVLPLCRSFHPGCRRRLPVSRKLAKMVNLKTNDNQHLRKWFRWHTLFKYSQRQKFAMMTI